MLLAPHFASYWGRTDSGSSAAASFVGLPSLHSASPTFLSIHCEESQFSSQFPFEYARISQVLPLVRAGQRALLQQCQGSVSPQRQHRGLLRERQCHKFGASDGAVFHAFLAYL